MGGVQVKSEIGPLKQVLMHRPGEETQQYPHGDFLQVFYLRPAHTEFDLAKAQAEHDRLTTLLSDEGVEVLHVQDLLVEAIDSTEQARTELTEAYVKDGRIEGIELTEGVKEHLAKAITSEQFVKHLFEGVRYGDIDLLASDRQSLATLTGSSFDADTFLINPINAAFFTRDPMSVVGKGITLNHMYWQDRNQEVNVLEAVARHHPRFASAPSWFDHRCSFHLEGGDLVNLDAHTLAVGLSSRTEAAAIDVLARRLLWEADESEITSIYAFDVPQIGNRLHLDTCISRIDYDTFVVDPALAQNPTVFKMSRGRKEGSVSIKELSGDLRSMFKQALDIGPIRLMDLDSGASNRIEFERDNGATSMLCLAPGNLCVCEENVTANNLLDKAGMTLHPVSIQEMTAGFGGPTSLCLPLWRENV